MNVSGIGSAASYSPQIASRVQATTPKPVPVSAPVDADGDHDGSTASSGRVDLKL